MFIHKSERGTCLLESICDLVRRVFYGGKLVVAQDRENNPF